MNRTLNKTFTSMNRRRQLYVACNYVLQYMHMFPYKQFFFLLLPFPRLVEEGFSLFVFSVSFLFFAVGFFACNSKFNHITSTNSIRMKNGKVKKENLSLKNTLIILSVLMLSSSSSEFISSTNSKSSCEAAADFFALLLLIV